MKDSAREDTFLENIRPPFSILTMIEWCQNEKGGLSLRYYLAIDIGASSGRHIVGWQENDTIQTKEALNK